MGKKHREGFTLIELLVLMMVMAFALGLGIPAFSAMMANARMSGAANELVGSIHAARSEASARGRNVMLCASSDWEDERPSCDVGTSLLAGWIAFEDGNANGVLDDEETVLQSHGPLDATIRRQPGSRADTAAPEYMSFRSDGLVQDIGGQPALRNIQLCDERGDIATGTDGDDNEIAAGRWIAISVNGRPQLRRLRSEVQANVIGGC